MSQCLFGLTLHWLITIFNALWSTSPFTTPVSDFGLRVSCALSAFCKGCAFQTPQTSWLLRSSGLNQVVRNVSNLMTNNVYQAWTALDSQEVCGVWNAHPLQNAERAQETLRPKSLTGVVKGEVLQSALKMVMSQCNVRPNKHCDIVIWHLLYIFWEHPLFQKILNFDF
jgi:hypothetical protein